MAACMAATLTFAIKSVVVIININMDFFIYGRNCCQFFFVDLTTGGGNLGPKLQPGGGFFGP